MANFRDMTPERTDLHAIMEDEEEESNLSDRTAAIISLNSGARTKAHAVDDMVSISASMISSQHTCQEEEQKQSQKRFKSEE